MKEEEKEALERIEKWLNKEESYCTDEDIKTVLNLIETQTKIINLIAEQLTTPINDKEWVIEYYTKLVEETKYGKTNNNKL